MPEVDNENSVSSDSPQASSRQGFEKDDESGLSHLLCSEDNSGSNVEGSADQPIQGPVQSGLISSQPNNAGPAMQEGTAENNSLENDVETGVISEGATARVGASQKIKNGVEYEVELKGNERPCRRRSKSMTDAVFEEIQLPMNEEDGRGDIPLGSGLATQEGVTIQFGQASDQSNSQRNERRLSQSESDLDNSGFDCSMTELMSDSGSYVTSASQLVSLNNSENFGQSLPDLDPYTRMNSLSGSERSRGGNLKRPERRRSKSLTEENYSEIGNINFVQFNKASNSGANHGFSISMDDINRIKNGQNSNVMSRSQMGQQKVHARHGSLPGSNLSRSITSQKSHQSWHVSSRRGSSHSRTNPLYKATQGPQHLGLGTPQNSRSLTRKASTESGQTYGTGDVQGRRIGGARVQRRLSQSWSTGENADISQVQSLSESKQTQIDPRKNGPTPPNPLNRSITSQNSYQGSHASSRRGSNHSRTTPLYKVKQGPQHLGIGTNQNNRSLTRKASTESGQIYYTDNVQGRRVSGARVQRRLSQSWSVAESADGSRECIIHSASQENCEEIGQSGSMHQNPLSRSNTSGSHASSRTGSNHSSSIPLYNNTRQPQHLGVGSSLTRKASTESGQIYYTDDVQGRRVCGARVQRRMSQSLSAAENADAGRGWSLYPTPDQETESRSATTLGLQSGMDHIESAMKHTLAFTPLRKDSLGGGLDNMCTAAAKFCGPHLDESMKTAATASISCIDSSHRTDVMSPAEIDVTLWTGIQESMISNNDRTSDKRLVKSNRNSWWRSRRFQIILALAIILVCVVVIVVTGGGQSKASVTSVENSDPLFPKPTIPPSLIDEDFAVLAPAPRDIEGRCSPSNLPGSKSACLEACRGAACCYVNIAGGLSDNNVCFDTSSETTYGVLNSNRCNGYRPYCDIFFDPWEGAEEGKIRPISSSLEKVCKHRKREHINTDSDEEVGDSGLFIPSRGIELFHDSSGSTSAGVENGEQLYGRHRQHGSQMAFRRDYTQGNYSNKNEIHRNLDGGFETCFQACLPSKCCIAHKLTGNPADQGYSLLLGGITTLTATGDYVMTNCALQNKGSCDDYANFCEVEYIEMAQEIVSSEPPMTSDVTIASPEETYIPSPSPTDSFKPTISFVPLAPLSDIIAKCTGPRNVDLIVNGDTNARNECLDVCQDGLCCYDTLNMASFYSTGIVHDIESCYQGNEDVCAGYSGCLALSLNSNDVSPQQAPQKPTTGIAGSIVPPKPLRDLAELCSSENRADPLGMLDCFKECQKGSCCGMPLTQDGGNDESDTGVASCFEAHEEICGLYGPCQALADAYGGDGGPNSPLPPLPPKNLDVLCSYDYLFETRQSNENDSTGDESECENACDAASCCFHNTCPEAPQSSSTFEDMMEGRCSMYESCRNLEPLPPPPSIIVQFCQSENNVNGLDSECQSICDVAACCFPESSLQNSKNDNGKTESCFALFKDVCLEYAPYCTPPPKADGSIGADVPSPPRDLLNVCNGSSKTAKACKRKCEPSACCFDPNPKENCFRDNESVCGEWSECAKQIQLEKEVFVD